MAELLLISDPKATPPKDYQEKFYNYLHCYEFSKILSFLYQINVKSSNNEQHHIHDDHYSFVVSTQSLIEYDSALSYFLFNYPTILLPLFQETLTDLLNDIIEHPSFLRSLPARISTPNSSNRPQTPQFDRKPTIPKNLHIRFSSLPPINDFVKPSISHVRAQECNSLIQLSGTIVRTGAVRMLELSKKYQCHNHRCRHSFRVYADPEQDYLIPQLKYCPNMIRNTNNNGIGEMKKCNSSTLQEVEDERRVVDYQEIKVQDRMEQLPFGTAPRSMIVILEADLVDKFNAGDDIIVIGTLIRRWRSPYPGSRCTIDLMIQANNIFQPYNDQQSQPPPPTQFPSQNLMISFPFGINSSYSEFEEFWRTYRSTPSTPSSSSSRRNSIQDKELYGRNIILQSICPQLYGLFIVKLSLLMALIGGSSTSYDTGVRRRSQIHLLMVGDPGCGKSQLLRFASKLIPRSVLTTGIGTTGAGLTCTAVKDGHGSNEWALEAGALVLANGGICCIDEFSSIREQDRTTIHEAMEQQTISIAKAGLVAKLPTRTTVIACCNPKGQYDLSADITVNTAIASPLLSRFDIILILIDQPNKEWDKSVSTHLLKRSIELGQRSSYQQENSKSANSSPANGSQRSKDAPAASSSSSSSLLGWDEKKLREYINCVKRIKPVMTDAAQQLIIRFYQMQRQNEDRSTSRTTVRLLESLVRVSEAHARLMFHTHIEIMDAVMAILCISISGSVTSVLDNALEVIKEDFCHDSPNDQYERHERRVFQMLQYSKEKLWKEIEKKNPNTKSIASNYNGSERKNEYSRVSDTSIIESEVQRLTYASNRVISNPFSSPSQKRVDQNEINRAETVTLEEEKIEITSKQREIRSNQKPVYSNGFLYEEEDYEEINRRNENDFSDINNISSQRKRGLPEADHTNLKTSLTPSSSQKRVRLSDGEEMSKSQQNTSQPTSQLTVGSLSSSQPGPLKSILKKSISSSSPSSTTSYSQMTSVSQKSLQTSLKDPLLVSEEVLPALTVIPLPGEEVMTQTFYNLDAIEETKTPISVPSQVPSLSLTTPMKAVTKSNGSESVKKSAGIEGVSSSSKKNIFLKSSKILQQLDVNDLENW